MKKFKVTFSEDNSGYMLEEENEYSGDMVHTITVNSTNWEESFTDARNAFYEANPNANRITNFDSKEI